jgi:hypothetical protein
MIDEGELPLVQLMGQARRNHAIEGIVPSRQSERCLIPRNPADRTTRLGVMTNLPRFLEERLGTTR